MPSMTRPIMVLAVVAWAYGQPAERQAASPDIQEPRTESLLGNIAPIAHSIHNERGFPLAYENRDNLSFADWRRKGRAEVARTLSMRRRLCRSMCVCTRRSSAQVMRCGASHSRRPRTIGCPPQFNVEMQDDAFEWLERWLRRP
jgi:hypothetical protein